MESKSISWWGKLTSKTHSARYSRLAAEIDTYNILLQKRIGETNVLVKNDISDREHTNTSDWTDSASQLMQNADQSLKEYRYDEAWKAIHAAKRLEIYGMNEEERLAYSKQLVAESSKLNEWRRKAIMSSIDGKNKSLNAMRNPEILIRAAEIRDEHFDNLYYKNQLAQNMFLLLFLMLLGLVVLVLFYFSLVSEPYNNLSVEAFSISDYIGGVLLFGLLGSTTSSVLFIRSVLSSRIIEFSANWVIALSKIFVGAAFSLFIFFLLNSSLAESVNVFSFTISSPYDYFAVAFVSGFSERFAHSAIEAIGGGSK
jgi:hypothetical protein